MNRTPALADVVSRVRQLLDGIGDALVAGRVDHLLATEAALADAVDTLSRLPASISSSHDLTAREPLRAELCACRVALARCRRLGASLQALASATLVADGRSGGYTREGEAAVIAPARHLEARG